MNKQFAAGLLCLTVAASVLTGCGKKQEPGSSGSAANKLTYWVTLNGNVAATSSDFGETPFVKELEKRLNVDLEFQHPPQGSEAEKFNVMMAMSDLPDIIEYSWAGYPGGPGKAITDKKILGLQNDLETKAPNLAKVLAENPTAAKLSKTDKGEIFGFPYIRGDKSLQVWTGLVVRNDWIKELNLSIPETIDEWETVLTAFKEKKGVSAPLSILPGQFRRGILIGAWNVTDDYYVDGGKIKYGALEPGFKEFLTTMNRWYENGLLSKDLPTLDNKVIDNNILNGGSGATAGAIGSGIGRWQASAKAEGYELAGAPYPTLKKGDAATFSDTSLMVPGVFAAITTSCKNPDLAYKVLDYGYSNDGYMLYNFGIEGESYNMKDGYPTYTDTITKNAEGLSMSASMARYVRSCADGPFVQDKRYMEQYAALPQQKQAWAIWSKTDGEQHMVPHIYIDDAAASDIAKKSTSITTYESEMVLNFIMGNEPLSKYDAFVSELKNRGIDAVIAEKQKAYDRYLVR